MPSTQTSRKYLDYATILGRWFLAYLFIKMGLSKALHPVEFLKLVREYDLVSNSLALNFIAATLPWFEVFCGLLLLAGVAVRGSALILVGMLVPFTAAVIHRAVGLSEALGKPFCAIKFDCGCGNGEVLICSKVLENSGLILLALWLLFGFGQQLCIRYSLLTRQGTQPPSMSNM